MAKPFDELARELAESGLISANDMAAIRSTVALDNVSPKAEEFVQQLVAAGQLTPYQALMLSQGQAKGLVLGDYVILDRLGSGGMGVVYKAEHRRMKRHVALKVLSPDLVGSADKLRRFQREAVAAAKLCHSNIVMALDAREDNGVHYLVTEFVEGRDLAAKVREHGRLPVDLAIDCVLEAARGLEYAHSRGVIHRDIKPSNLLLDKNGTVKILDMGLARLQTAGDSTDDDPESRTRGLTETGVIMGTVDFMAPEQALDTRSADPRSDIYSLGCTLYYLVTARLPFREETTMKTLVAHREKPVPLLRAERADVPIELDWILEKMLAKRPSDRYQTATALIHDLEQCRSGVGESESGPKDDRPTYPAGPLEWLERASSSSSADDIHLADSAFADNSTRTTSDVPTTAERARRGGEVLTRPTESASTNALSHAKSVTGRVEAALVKPSGHDPLNQIGRWQITGGIRRLFHRREFWIAVLVVVCVSIALLFQTVGGIRDKKVDGRTTAIPEGDTVTIAPKDNVVSQVPSSQPVENYALEFDGKRCFVEIHSFAELAITKDNPRQPYTIEATVLAASRQMKGGQASIISGFPLRLLQYAWGVDTWRLTAAVAIGPLPYQDSDGLAEPGRKTHLAAVYDGRTMRLFVNGKKQFRSIRQFVEPKEREVTGEIGLTNRAFRVMIGADAAGPAAHNHVFHGLIDEVHISKVARYTKDYLPPKRFEADSDTLALYHFDEGEGDMLVDSSGNGRHGKIFGAKWVRVDDNLNVIGAGKPAQPSNTQGSR